MIKYIIQFYLMKKEKKKKFSFDFFDVFILPNGPTFCWVVWFCWLWKAMTTWYFGYIYIYIFFASGYEHNLLSLSGVNAPGLPGS